MVVVAVVVVVAMFAVVAEVVVMGRRFVLGALIRALHEDRRQDVLVEELRALVLHAHALAVVGI